MDNHFDMKYKPILAVASLAVLVLMCLAATVNYNYVVDLKVENTSNTVGLIIQKPGAATLTQNVFEYYGGSVLKAAIKPDGSFWNYAPATQRKWLGIDSGTVTVAADGTVTNANFSATFTAAPKVFLTGSINATNGAIVSVTTTNFVCAGTVATNYNWLAIGQ